MRHGYIGTVLKQIEQSTLWKSPSFPYTKKKRKTSLPICEGLYFLSKAVVHYEYFPQGPTATDCLQNLVENVQQSDLESGFCDWFLHHDNEPVHTALSVPEFLARNKMTVLIL
jgi:hypothetical protein